MNSTGRIVLKSSPSEDLTPEDGVILGRALAMDHRRVVVSHDLMRSSPMMAEAVTSGLLSQGADVIDLGTVSAPAAARCARLGDCSVYVAGRAGMTSGYYLMNPDGGLFSDEQVRHLDMVFQNPPAAPDHGGLGRYSSRAGASDDYNEGIVRMFPGGAKCSVVVDCRCGTASDSLPQILNSLGADVLTINAQRDPDFTPCEGAEDGPGTRSLEMIVEADPGSIGIRVNSIGTAVEVIDEHGEPVPMEKVFALLIMYFRPRSVAVTADMTSLIEDALAGTTGAEIATPFEGPQGGGSLILTSDSAAEVCDAVTEGADMGYYHGSIVFAGGASIGDGIRAAAAVVQVAGDNSLHALAGSLPEYLRETRDYECDMKADAFRRAVEECIGQMADRCHQYGNAFRITMDGGWFMIRHVSREDGTGIEVLAESRDKAYVVGLMEMAGEIVERVLRLQRRRYTTSMSTGSPYES